MTDIHLYVMLLLVITSPHDALWPQKHISPQAYIVEQVSVKDWIHCFSLASVSRVLNPEVSHSDQRKSLVRTLYGPNRTVYLYPGGKAFWVSSCGSNLLFYSPLYKNLSSWEKVFLGLMWLCIYKVWSLCQNAFKAWCSSWGLGHIPFNPSSLFYFQGKYCAFKVMATLRELLLLNLAVNLRPLRWINGCIHQYCISTSMQNTLSQVNIFIYTYIKKTSIKHLKCAKLSQRTWCFLQLWEVITLSASS